MKLGFVHSRTCTPDRRGSTYPINWTNQPFVRFLIQEKDPSQGKGSELSTQTAATLGKRF